MAIAAAKDVPADTPEPGAAAAPQTGVPPEAPRARHVSTKASRGDDEEESSHSPGGKEPPMSEVIPSKLGMTPASDDPPLMTGRQIVVSGTAPEVVRLPDSLLSRAHQTIDRLGGSLSAERALLEAERRDLAAAWLQVHEACQACVEEQR